MVDREARRKVIEAIRAYMNDEICTESFDDQLIDAENLLSRRRRYDHAVIEVAETIRGEFVDRAYFDPLVADVAEWKYYNRAILLLESDAEIIEQSGQYHWSMQQASIALSLLVSLVWLSCILGMFGLGVFCLVGCLQFYLLQRYCPEQGINLALHPFPDVSSLLKLRRTMPHFEKRPYPAFLDHRRHDLLESDSDPGPVGMVLLWAFALPIICAYGTGYSIWWSFPHRRKWTELIIG